MTKEQLFGLAEVLPDGYPREGGLVVVRNKKGGSRKSRRRHSGKKIAFVPWYRQLVRC